MCACTVNVRTKTQVQLILVLIFSANHIYRSYRSGCTQYTYASVSKFRVGIFIYGYGLLSVSWCCVNVSVVVEYSRRRSGLSSAPPNVEYGNNIIEE